MSTKLITEQQKVERRERNREHAKRSRLRKKFLLESLQEQINGLNSEIDALKDVIRKELPTKAEELIESVSVPKGNFTPLPMPSGFGPVKTLMEPDFRLMSAYCQALNKTLQFLILVSLTIQSFTYHKVSSI